MQFNNQEYFFQKNIFGDVIGIWDNYGSKVGTYTYDDLAFIRFCLKAKGYKLLVQFDGSVWGKVLSHTDNTVTKANPFRYRGYYYDTETSLYYLNTRYYDPQTGRFLNADSPLNSLMQTGYADAFNLYAYALNNPVMYTDGNGQFIDYIFDAIFIAWALYDIIFNEGYKDWKNWAALGIDLIFAILPFIPAGGGQVVKWAGRADDLYDLRRVTVIGQGMDRVTDVARLLNATDNLYDGFKGYQRMSQMGNMGKAGAEIIGKGQNALWLFGKLRMGYTIVDVGYDMSRIVRGVRSSSYAMELAIMGIWRTRNIWKGPLNYYLLG